MSLMECPKCYKEYDDTCENLPDDQEERVLFRCRYCGTYFEGWWIVEHMANEISESEAQSKYFEEYKYEKDRYYDDI